MRTTTSRPTMAFLASGLVLALAACSGGSNGSSSSDGYEPGPLDEYFEQIYGDWNQEDSDAQMRRVEELTAECMAEEGFDYTPVDHSQGMSYSSDDLDVDWGSKEFAEQYGFGATTDPWGSQDDEPIVDEGQEWTDPNSEYVEAMSETEQTAYYEALHGDMTGPEEGMEEEWEYDWTEAGCSGWAQHQVWEGGDEGGGEFADLEEEMNTMWEATMADSRLADANAAWASCMADAGYPGYAQVGDAEQAFYDEVNAVYEQFYDEAGMDGTAEEWEAIDQQVQAAIAELTPKEIELAVADYECKESTNYNKIQTEVTHEYQQEFVDTHKAELDAWAEHQRSLRG